MQFSIFSTRFECSFTSSPLVSSVFFIVSIREELYGLENLEGTTAVKARESLTDILKAAEMAGQRETTLETSGEDVKLHSKRVEKIGLAEVALPGYSFNLIKENEMNLLTHMQKVRKLAVVLDYYEAMELTVVLDYYETIETYSGIGQLRSQGNLQSYWTTTKLRKLTVVLDYCEAIETYSRIGLLRSYENLQSYWTTTKLF